MSFFGFGKKKDKKDFGSTASSSKATQMTDEEKYGNAWL